MEGSRDKDQVLALKVMRLTKPSLMMGEACYGEEGRQAEGEGGERKEGEGGDNDCMLALRKVHNAQLASAHNLTEFRLGSLLTLPQNFGNIFLGETFSSYISVHNDSQETCKDITVKADLQTSSQRLTLSRNATKPTASLEPGRSIDDVIQHEVKELGTHILVCTVSYLTAAGENMFLRKFFKFQVLKPLDVKTKFYNAEDYISDEVFLEAQIQNITPGPIFVDHVSLEPSQDYQITNIDVPSDKELFGKVNCMSPLDIRQYLYCLIPKHESAKNSHLLKGVTNIGKLDIVWHTNMGEKGRLQTSALQRMAPGYGDLRVTITDVPDEVFAEKPFSFTCNVTNCSERSMQLDLFFENVPSSTGVTWAGISGQSLGNCAPGHTVKHPLKIVPLKTGLQTVSGLRIVDTFLGRKYEHDDLFQIFVYSEANHVRI